MEDLSGSQIRQEESMNQFIDRMDIKFLGTNLAGVGTSERERIDILANGIKSAHPSKYAFLRSLIGNPCKSIALASHGREILSNIPSDESEGEELATTKVVVKNNTRTWIAVNERFKLLF